MTGTRDSSPIRNMSPTDRLQVFPALRNAPAWQVVFENLEHMDFGERGMQNEGQEEKRYHKAILALTTAFWDAHLKGNPCAFKWLNGQGAKSVLTPEDQWEMNRLTQTDSESAADRSGSHAGDLPSKESKRPTQ